jgi:putative colanic acid biosynthesis acetyltransferase WcaF
MSTEVKQRTETDLSQYDCNWYKPGGAIKRTLWYFVNVLFFINPLNPVNGFKIALLRLFGAKVGNGVIIKPGVNIKYPWNLQIGNNTWIGENAWIDNLAPVSIGNNCCISQGAMLLCGNHNYRKSTFDLIVKPITMEDGSWVGAKAVVTPGVRLHSHAILTVMSVATSDLPSYTINKGNPAIVIRQREIASK